MTHEEYMFLYGDLYPIWVRNLEEKAQSQSDIDFTCTRLAVYDMKMQSGKCNMCNRPVINSGQPAEFGVSCRCFERELWMEVEHRREKEKTEKNIIKDLLLKLARSGRY